MKGAQLHDTGLSSLQTALRPANGAALSTARERRTALYAVSLLLDVLALFGGYIFAMELRPAGWLEPGGHVIITLACPLFIMFEIAREVQSVEALQDRLIGIYRALGALFGTAIVIIGIGFLLNADDLSRVAFAVTFGVAACLIVVSKVILDAIFKWMMGGSAIATMLILDGLDAQVADDAQIVDVGKMDLWPDFDRPEVIDRLSRLILPYDRVIVACQFEHRAAWASFLKGHDIGGEILLDRELLHGAVAIGEYDGRETIVLSKGPLNLANRIQKRVLDLVVAALGILIFAPLLLAVAIAIKLDSPGPVLFRQVRVGQGNRQFRIFKFRSMRQEKTDEAGHRSAKRDDDRVTRVGKFIRRTSIDELPQLLNVLRGDMSMVGPRPHALGSTAGDELFWYAKQYRLRHALKPGITGLAQIRGFRGATPRLEDLERRVSCDLEYHTNWSLWVDILILIKTLKVVVHKNAY